MEDLGLISSLVDYENQLFKEICSKVSKCGYSSLRCLKCIASTGLIDERVAGEWLSAHIDDPDIDKDCARDYYVFLCPNGVLCDSLVNYWKGCKKEGLWGHAQEYSPHITIVPRFQIADNKIVDLHTTIYKRIAKQPLQSQLVSAPLELLSTSDPIDLKKNFIGFQACGKAKSVLENFSNALLSDLNEIGIVMEESVRKSKKGIYHLSLSYGFSASHLSSLTALMEKYVTPFTKDDPLDKWNICLYSCDSRCRIIDELYRMRTPMKSWQLNNNITLAYNVGDLVGLINSPSVGLHGTAIGLNCATGLTGTFVLQHGDRVPLYHSWTLHRQWPLEVPEGSFPIVHIIERQASIPDSHGNSKSDKTNSRRVFVMRHGERVDFCFRNWIPKCFDSKGIYRRHNLNLPEFLPHRKQEHFFHDSPLTVVGAYIAFQTGVALREAGVVFTKCYSSSALRCVQTATQCLKGMGQESLGICLEPLLFEWMGWYKTQAPIFMTAEQLKLDGLLVNVDYVPLSRASELRASETPSQYYERKGRLVKRIIDANKKRGSTILIVGHAASLDVCTRPLICKASWPPQITEQEFHTRSALVPFCGLVVAEEHTLRWHLVDPPIPSFSHCKNSEFNWQQMMLPPH